MPQDPIHCVQCNSSTGSKTVLSKFFKNVGKHNITCAFTLAESELKPILSLILRTLFTHICNSETDSVSFPSLCDLLLA